MSSLYKPLAEGEIRLLVLEPSYKTRLPGQIQCDLKTVSIKDYEDRYEAMSYVWGTESATCTLTIERTPFAIRPTLASALQCFRQSRLIRPLWVDAVCINQSDIQERAQQVAMMSRIYDSARRVLIWLGPFDVDVASAFDYIDSRKTTKPINDSLDIQDREKTAAVIMEKVLSATWFNRVWVVQEFAVAVAPFFCCGKARLPAKALIHFLSSQSDIAELDIINGNPAKHPWLAEMALMQSFQQDTTVDDFHALLATFRSRLASDPRDKVFALAGLSGPLNRRPSHLLTARYDLSVIDAYRGAARYCLEVQQSSYLLCSAGLKADDPSWPSWIPDWSANAPPHFQPEGAMRYESLCDAVYRSKHVFRETRKFHPCFQSAMIRVPSSMEALATVANGDTLSIRGVFVRCLCEAWPSMSLLEESEALYYHFRELSYGNGLYGKHFQSQGHTERQRSVWAKQLATEVHAHLEPISRPRAFGFLEGGLVIYGPSNMQVGDFVAIVLGCDVPLVFRHIQSHDRPALPRKCRLVGECYVHGLMDHRGAEKEDESEWLDEVAEWFEVT